ncbi:hypothetical protein ACFQ6Q_00295 [Streptomyces sp. NPDC056437]|uniref:hypothetical protein n=1 Tax=Streptomyces sp. NPDC056437 TaxID=3345816 RepID=UPI00368DFD90
MAQATEARANNAAGPTSHTQNQLEELAARLERLLEQAEQKTGTHGYTREEQIEALHKLREPFAASEIRYRPQPWCKACSNAPFKVCERHAQIECHRCKQKRITDAHIDLAFVGHAEATNRLLNVDPFWDWEPLALDQAGLPQYDGNKAMWIRMTVCGMTRLGYGDATGKSGANAVKEIIGDAIRNAGMRFGMALDLWTPSDLEIIESGGEALADAPAKESAPSQAVKAPATAAPEDGAAADALLNKLMLQAAQNRHSPDVLRQVRGHAEKGEVINRSVQGPPPERAWMPFHELLDVLEKAAKSQGGTGKAAA